MGDGEVTVAQGGVSSALDLAVCKIKPRTMDSITKLTEKRGAVPIRGGPEGACELALCFRPCLEEGFSGNQCTPAKTVLVTPADPYWKHMALFDQVFDITRADASGHGME